MRSLTVAGFALLLLPLASRAGTPASQSPTTSAPTQSSTAHPIWPDNGIAQRRFTAGGNGTMFVEDDHGKLHAWVSSDYTKLIDHDHAYATVLDFFSGKVIKVKVDLTEDGHQDQAFTGPDGRYHFYSADPRFRFSGVDMQRSLPGLAFSLFNGDTINVAGGIPGCSLSLDATMAVKNYVTDQEPAAVWQKFTIYHIDTGSRGCPSGYLSSMIVPALDLGDGTFLAAEGCFVFRLRKSDLSPVGSAPALRVVDESTVKAVLAKLHGKKIDNPTGYLIKQLNLPTGPNVSCKED